MRRSNNGATKQQDTQNKIIFVEGSMVNSSKGAMKRLKKCALRSARGYSIVKEEKMGN